jgi:hypothetical protein
MCTCDTKPNHGSQATTLPAASINLALAHTLASAMMARTAGEGASIQQLHVMHSGDVIASSMTIFPKGKLTINFAGTVGLIPVALDVTVEATDKTVAVTIELTKPIKVGPKTWIYNTAAGGLTLESAPDLSDQHALGGIPFMCILKCGATSILPILLQCLPSISGGPAAFIACVVAQGGQGVTQIAACIAACL